jgi:hypothetical protein
MDERRIFRACKPVRDACRLTAIPILIPLGQRSLATDERSVYCRPEIIDHLLEKLIEGIGVQ